MKDRNSHLSSMPHARHLKKRHLRLQREREEQEASTAAGDDAARSSPSSNVARQPPPQDQHTPPSSSPSPRPAGGGERPVGVGHHPPPPPSASASSPPPQPQPQAQPPLQDPYVIAALEARYAKDAADWMVGGPKYLQHQYEQHLRQNQHALLAREQEREQQLGRGQLIHPSPHHLAGAHPFHDAMVAAEDFRRFRETEQRKMEEELRNIHALMRLQQLHQSPGMVMRHLTPPTQLQAPATDAGAGDDGSLRRHLLEAGLMHVDMENLLAYRQRAMEDGHRQREERDGHGQVDSTDDALKLKKYHTQLQRQQQLNEDENRSPLKTPQHSQPQPGRLEQHEQRTPLPKQSPANGLEPRPLPELPFLPTPGTYTCDLLLEGSRLTPTPSELARSLRCAYGLLLGPSMGAVADPLKPPPEIAGEGRGGGGKTAPHGPGPHPPVTVVNGVVEEATSQQQCPPPRPPEVLSEILSLPQACFLTILPNDPPRVVVAHSLGRYYPPSSFPGDIRDPYRNRIVAFVGERFGVVPNDNKGGEGTSSSAGGTPHARADDDSDGQLLDDVMAGGDDSASSGASLPSIFVAPTGGGPGLDGAAAELFGPRRYSLIPRDALDECYGGGGRGGGDDDGGGIGDAKDDGGGHRRVARGGPSPGDDGSGENVGTSSNPTDYDVEAGGGVEEAYVTKLAYIPPSWAVHFLGGMGPYQALRLATRLVNASLPDVTHRSAADPLLRWLRLACQSDPLRGDRASAASVDWSPVLPDDGGVGGGGLRGYAVRRMRFAMRATAAVAAQATSGGTGTGGGGGGGGGNAGLEDLRSPPRSETVLDGVNHGVIGHRPGGGDATDLEGSSGAIVAVAEEEREDEQSPKKHKHESSRSGSPPLKKRCRGEEHLEEKAEDTNGRPPQRSPQGPTEVNLGGAFAAHGAEKEKAEDGGLKDVSTGTAVPTVPNHPPPSPTLPRDEEESKRMWHHAVPGDGGEGEGNDHPSVVSASTSLSSSGDSSSTQLPPTVAAFTAAPPTSSTRTGGNDDLDDDNDDSPSPSPQLPPRIIDRHHATDPSAAVPVAPPASAEEARGGVIEVEFSASPVGSSSSTPPLSCRHASSSGRDDATPPQVKRECHDKEDHGSDGGIGNDDGPKTSPAMAERRTSEAVSGVVLPQSSPSPTRDIRGEGEEGGDAVTATGVGESNDGRVGDRDGVAVSPSPQLSKVGGGGARRDDDGCAAEEGNGANISMANASSSLTTSSSTSESASNGEKMARGNDPKGRPSTAERTAVSKGGRSTSSSSPSASKNGASGGKIGGDDPKGEASTEVGEMATTTAGDDSASLCSPSSTSKGIAVGRKGGGDDARKASSTKGATASAVDHEAASSSSSRAAAKCRANGRERGCQGKGDSKRPMPPPSPAEEGDVAVSSTGGGGGGGGGATDDGCSESATSAAKNGSLQQHWGQGQGKTMRRNSNPANNKNTTTTRREHEQFELEFINVTMLDAQEVADRLFGHDGVRHRQFMRETQCKVYLRGRGRACSKFPFRQGEDDTQLQVILQGRTRFSVIRAKGRVMGLLSDLMSRVSSASYQSPATEGVVDGGRINHHGHRPNSQHASTTTAAAGQKRNYEDAQLNRYNGNAENFVPETGNPAANRHSVHHFGGPAYGHYGPSVPSQQQDPATSRRGTGHFPGRYDSTYSARGGYTGADEGYYQGSGWNDGYYGGGGGRPDTYGSSGWSSVQDQCANGRWYSCDAEEHGSYSERNAMPTSDEKNTKIGSGLGLITRSVRLAEMCSFPDKLVDILIGQGGEGIKSLRESTYCHIDIDRTAMVVKITGKTDERVNKALQMVKERCKRNSS